jgi:RNA polymerase sigma-70 factor, ECF subfamily
MAPASVPLRAAGFHAEPRIRSASLIRLRTRRVLTSVRPKSLEEKNLAFGNTVAIAHTPVSFGKWAPKRMTSQKRDPVAAVDPQNLERQLRDHVRAIAVNQDRAAFHALYRHYAPRLKSYCLRQGADRETAEELAQEAMVQVWRKAATYDADKASVSTWMFTIVRNKRIDLIRRERRPELTAEDFEVMVQPEVGVEQAAIAASDAEMVGLQLDLLPEEQKAVLMKAFYEDKSHSEIAAETGLPLGTVKSRIRLALTRLKILVADTQAE